MHESEVLAGKSSHRIRLDKGRIKPLVRDAVAIKHHAVAVMQIEAVLCRAAARKDARQCENSPKSPADELTSSLPAHPLA